MNGPTIVEQIRFDQLMREQAEWQERNCPTDDMDERRRDMALGIIEELGKLAHAVLKIRQGIKTSPDGTTYLIYDAIGELTIYLAGYCSAAWVCAKCDIGDGGIHSNRPNPYDWIDWIMGECRCIASFAKSHDRHMEITGVTVGSLLLGLSGLSIVMDIDFGDAVWDTWAKVKQRDWKANPMDAREKAVDWNDEANAACGESDRDPNFAPAYGLGPFCKGCAYRPRPETSDVRSCYLQYPRNCTRFTGETNEFAHSPLPPGRGDRR